jgi:hypothetical protein
VKRNRFAKNERENLAAQEKKKKHPNLFAPKFSYSELEILHHLEMTRKRRKTKNVIKLT